MSQQEEMKNLSLLGNKETNYIFEYQPEVLESFDNRHVENDYFIKFNCPEFTSLCPITAQPDFATIYISYIPDKLCVESKSLKLYLFSYRNHGDFHENCINTIGKDLVNLLDPRYLEVSQAAKDFITEEGYDEVMGVRPLRRVVEQQIRDKVTDFHLDHLDAKHLEADMEDGGLVIREKA